MYIKRITLENVGPIEKLEFDLPFNGDNPTPVILVGENGTGKSITLSHIINSMIEFRQTCGIENTETEKGKVYKIRSSEYIRMGEVYSFSDIEFTDELRCYEWELISKKKDLDSEKAIDLQTKPFFSSIDNENSEYFGNNFSSNKQKCRDLEESSVLLYFPSSRFEEPAWLNERNLLSKVTYQDISWIAGISDRKIIVQNNLNELKNWVFDILFDHYLNRPTQIVGPGVEVVTPGYSSYYTQIITVLGVILSHKFSSPNFRFANRKNRIISIFDGENKVCKNIFTLSTGETLLLNLALSIIKDGDFTNKKSNDTIDLEGIVLIDEIDLHLHTRLQKEILPKLIKLFPKIQFIITTHSPLFVLGMEEIFGEENIEIREMPTGNKITAERFKEFDKAFSYFTETKKYEEKVEKDIIAINEFKKTIIISEGNNSTYLRKAKDYFDNTGNYEFFEQKEFGDKEIEKLFKFLLKTQNRGPKKIFILDCDSSDIFNRLDNLKTEFLLPIIVEKNPKNSKVRKGIENLFPEEIFSDDVYKSKTQVDDYGGRNTITTIDKNAVESKISTRDNEVDFVNFRPLFEQIKSICNQPEISPS